MTDIEQQPWWEREEDAPEWVGQMTEFLASMPAEEILETFSEVITAHNLRHRRKHAPSPDRINAALARQHADSPARRSA